MRHTFDLLPTYQCITFSSSPLTNFFMTPLGFGTDLKKRFPMLHVVSITDIVQSTRRIYKGALPLNHHYVT